MKEDPKAHFDKVLKIYNVAKKKFNRSEYSALLAILLADLIHEDSCEAVLTRGKELYDQIKMAHPFLTNEQNSVLAGRDFLGQENLRHCGIALRTRGAHGLAVHGDLRPGRSCDHFNAPEDALHLERLGRVAATGELTSVATNNLAVPNTKFATGKYDSNNIAEVTILARSM